MITFSGLQLTLAASPRLNMPSPEQGASTSILSKKAGNIIDIPAGSIFVTRAFITPILSMLRDSIAALEGMISFGASPRASISLALAARAYAFIKHRGYVIPEDVRAVCHDVLRHRIGISYEAEANNLTSEEIISEILNKVEVP